MNRQIAVRIPEELVEFVDELVTSGQARSRAAAVTGALERERRRAVAERDARNELEPERCSARWNLPSLSDARWLEVRHQLPYVVLRLAVFRTVIDANVGVVAVGDCLAEPEQRMPLTAV